MTGEAAGQWCLQQCISAVIHDMCRISLHACTIEKARVVAFAHFKKSKNLMTLFCERGAAGGILILRAFAPRAGAPVTFLLALDKRNMNKRLPRYRAVSKRLDRPEWQPLPTSPASPPTMHRYFFDEAALHLPVEI